MKKRKRIKKNIKDLCYDNLFEIFSFLNFKYVCSLRLVCKTFSKNCNSEQIWKNLLKGNFPDGYKFYPKKRDKYYDIFKEFYYCVNKNKNLTYYYEQKHFLIELVKRNGWLLEYASEELKNDKEVVLEAVNYYGQFLRYASEELKNDKEVVLEAVKQNGFSLVYASEELKNDKDVVLEAVKQNGWSFKYASEELQNDKEVVLEADKSDAGSLEFLSDEIKNREFMLESLIFSKQFYKKTD